MSELKLYNTLTRTKERFIPNDPACITMYVCGPTVYNLAHIGNARPVVVFDCLFRLLDALYPKVMYARNITDIDDKIIQAAAERNSSIDVITREFTHKYREDMGALNALTPTIEPLATEHLAEMIALIERLLTSNSAYVSDDHVLFFCSVDARLWRTERQKA
jgi:cysteinyl-tRNA synthetase